MLGFKGSDLKYFYSSGIVDFGEKLDVLCKAVEVCSHILYLGLCESSYICYMWNLWIVWCFLYGKIEGVYKHDYYQQQSFSGLHSPGQSEYTITCYPWVQIISCMNQVYWNCISISVSGQLPTYPSPNPTLTLTCCQLTVVELGEG